MVDHSKMKVTLTVGLVLALIELIIFIAIHQNSPDLALKILGMIVACHVGGGLAFIGTGFELGLSSLSIMIIILLYNTMVVIVIYALFILLFENVSKLKIVLKLHQKVHEARKLRSRWTLLGIAFFIWIPLPMTGAVIGSMIAYFEGYEKNRILYFTLPAMWLGVISWTAAFEYLYGILRHFNPIITTIFTFLLLIFPFIYNLYQSQFKHKNQNQ